MSCDLASSGSCPWQSSSPISLRMTPHSSGSLSGLNAGTLPAFSNSTPLCRSSVASPPSSTIERRAAAVWPLERFVRAPPVLVERLALPREHRNALRILHRAARFRTADDDRRGGVILRREDVARHPAHVGAELGQRLDEHGRLDGHVQAAHDARAGERLARRRTACGCAISPGISCSARRISLRPNSASDRSCDLVRLAAGGLRGLERVPSPAVPCLLSSMNEFGQSRAYRASLTAPFFCPLRQTTPGPFALRVGRQRNDANVSEPSVGQQPVRL